MAKFDHLALKLLDEPRQPAREKPEEAEIEGLALSIREVGLLQPLGVVLRAGRYEVVFGHRRLLACRRVGYDPVPCNVLGEEEAAHLRATLAENVERKDLTPVEEAKVLRDMVDGHGQTVPATARALGRSEAWVRSRLEMLRWPAEFLELVHKGELAASVARELVLIEDPVTRDVYLRSAINSGCSAAQARMWRQDWEVSRPMYPEPEAVPLPGPSPITHRVPLVTCGACELPVPAVEARVLMVCRACQTILLQTPNPDVGAVG